MPEIIESPGTYRVSWNNNSLLVSNETIKLAINNPHDRSLILVHDEQHRPVTMKLADLSAAVIVDKCLQSAVPQLNKLVNDGLAGA